MLKHTHTHTHAHTRTHTHTHTTSPRPYPPPHLQNGDVHINVAAVNVTLGLHVQALSVFPQHVAPSGMNDRWCGARCGAA